MASDAPVHRKPSSPINGSGLPVLGSIGGGAAAATGSAAGAGAGVAHAGAGAGAAADADGDADDGAGAGAAATVGRGGAGADPVTVVLDAISTRGSSTIFSAETVMPLRRS